MSEVMKALFTLAVAYSQRIIAALIVYFIGSRLIQHQLKRLPTLVGFKRLDSTVQSFTLALTKYGLYGILLIIIIGILGVPMASIITLLGAAGVAIGLALQGALANVAGGIMLLINRPFNVGDYIVSGDASGTVSEINLYYTILKTPDNRKITIPNGSLMNANIENYSFEKTRRVDLTYTCAKSEDVEKVMNLIQKELDQETRALQDPKPVVRLLESTNEAHQFSARAWVNKEDYWNVYFDLNKAITLALKKAKVKVPAIHVVTEK